MGPENHGKATTEHAMNKKIGRNDPCHCGSGKKYKRCHLVLDARQEVPAHALPESSRSEEDFESANPPADVPQVLELLQQLSRRGPKTQRAEFQKMLKQTEPIVNYLSRQREIESASQM